MGKEQDYCLEDISACHHCKSFAEHGYYDVMGVVYCLNEKSPYYHSEFTRYVALIFETLRGCDEFSIKEKISQRLYQHLPNDSPLRKLPLEEVISDWDGTSDLMSTKTSSQILQELKTRKPSQIIKEMVPKV